MNMKMDGQLIRYRMTLADLSVEISGTMSEIEFSPIPSGKQKKKKKKRLENTITFIQQSSMSVWFGIK